MTSVSEKGIYRGDQTYSFISKIKKLESKIPEDLYWVIIVSRTGNGAKHCDEGSVVDRIWVVTVPYKLRANNKFDALTI